MCKLKISLLILVLTATILAQENSTEVQQEVSDNVVTSTEKPQEKFTTTEEPSFFYRWANWFNPFSRSSQEHGLDLVSEATHSQYSGQYLPPPQNDYHQQQPPCNPCDQEPWIPIAGQTGRNTVIGFVNPSHLGHQGPPPNSYGAPQEGAPLLNSYGAPAAPQPLPSLQYGAPQQQDYDQQGYPTVNKPALALPLPNDNYRTLTNTFMPPPPQKGAGYSFHPTLRLKPTTSNFNHHKPLGHGPPIPLNYGKPKQNYAPQFANNFQKHPHKLIPPSTSYGIPVQNDLHTANTQHFNRYPNHQHRPQNTDHKFAGVKLPFNYYPNIRTQLKPVPFPQLSLTPVAPLHNYQPFHSIPDNYLQNNQKPVVHDVQVVPSIQVAGYLASIEHPVNIIQSPLVEVSASENSEQLDPNQIQLDEFKTQLNQNPIIVEEDNNAAASVQNATYHNPEQNSKRHNDKDVGSSFAFLKNTSQTLYTPPPFDYNSWTPSMHPPPVQDHSWFSSTLNEDQFVSSTKKPKQVQIIIPYTSQTNGPKDNNGQQLPLFTVPPQQDAVWTKFVDNHLQELNRVTPPAATARPYTTVLNIKDFLLKEQQWNGNYKNLPYDVVRLQKNIDVWTEKEFSKNQVNIQKDSTVSKLVPSKKIPSEYLTTQPYYKDSTTLRNVGQVYDHESAGSNNIEDNLLVGETTEIPSTTDDSTIITTVFTTNLPPASIPGKALLPSLAAAKSMWDKLKVSISPSTKEKIYVVTPQPWNFTPEEINQKLLRIAQFANIPLSSPKFSVIIQPHVNLTKNETKEVIRDSKNGLQIVYSEWPHLINNLLTSTTEAPKPVTKHPLFGLMDISSYTPPPNSTVETYGGHSKVITVVTPANVAKKKVNKLTKQ